MATNLSTMVPLSSLESRSISAPVLAMSILSERDKLVALAPNYPFLQPAIRALTRIAKNLSKPLTVAILGEPNAGKSSLANMICGVSALPTMPMANTRVPTVLRYASVPGITVADALHALSDNAASSHHLLDLTHIEVGLPSDILHEFQIIDYPNACEAALASLLKDFQIRRPDIGIWTTTATQAWRESERSMWSAMRGVFRGQALLVVTHIDLLQHLDDLKKLEGRLKPLIGQAFDHIVFASLKGRDEVASAKVIGALKSMKADLELSRVEKAKMVVSRIAGRTLATLTS